MDAVKIWSPGQSCQRAHIIKFLSLESNRRNWQPWLANVEGDLRREPVRVRNFIFPRREYSTHSL
jgi:hypothetical protein